MIETYIKALSENLPFNRWIFSQAYEALLTERAILTECWLKCKSSGRDDLATLFGEEIERINQVL